MSARSTARACGPWPGIQTSWLSASRAHRARHGERGGARLTAGSLAAPPRRYHLRADRLTYGKQQSVRRQAAQGWHRSVTGRRQWRPLGHGVMMRGSSPLGDGSFYPFHVKTPHAASPQSAPECLARQSAIQPLQSDITSALIPCIGGGRGGAAAPARADAPLQSWTTATTTRRPRVSGCVLQGQGGSQCESISQKRRTFRHTLGGEPRAGRRPLDWRVQAPHPCSGAELTQATAVGPRRISRAGRPARSWRSCERC